MEFQEGGRRQALELAEAKKGGAASQSPAMCDSAAEDVKKEKTEKTEETGRKTEIKKNKKKRRLVREGRETCEQAESQFKHVVPSNNY